MGRKDITRNLFFWFRGPVARSGKALDRQLENNITKSFITLLEHTDRKVFLRDFLRDLGLPFAENVSFSLQRRPILATKTSRRVLLSITGGDPKLVESRTPTRTGRPDAWLSSGGWTVLVESKIGRRVKTGQLVKHAKAAGWSKGTYTIKHRAWEQLYRLMQRALAKCPRREKVSHLLVQEWLAYLEHQNMTEFDKVESIDFDFFNLPEDERRSLLPTMRKRMRAFAESLSRRPPVKRMAALYANYRVKDWKYSEPKTGTNSFWFNIGGDPSHRTWHATVFFRPSGLSLELLNSGNHLVRKLCRSGVDCFGKIITAAAKSKDTYVGVRRAWYRDPESSYKGQHIAHADTPISMLPATLDGPSRESYALILKNAIQNMLADKRFRTELNIVYAIPRDKVVALAAGKQTTLVSRGLRQLHRILEYLLMFDQ